MLKISFCLFHSSCFIFCSLWSYLTFMIIFAMWAEPGGTILSSAKDEIILYVRQKRCKSDESRPFSKRITLGKTREYNNNKNYSSTKGLLKIKTCTPAIGMLMRGTDLVISCFCVLRGTSVILDQSF